MKHNSKEVHQWRMYKWEDSNTPKSSDNSFGALENREEEHKDVDDTNIIMNKGKTTIKSQGKGDETNPIFTKGWITKSIHGE